MPAVKAKNRTNVHINQNFIIWVKEPDKKATLTSANKCINYIVDDKLKIKMFNEVLQGQRQIYTFKIRSRLIIKFYSK